MINLNAWGKTHPIEFQFDNYVDNGNLYVGMVTTEDGYPEPWSSLTVNLGVKCAENCAFIDTNNNGVGIIDWLLQNNLGRLTGREMPSGWCRFLEFEFNMEELRKHEVQ